MTEAQRDDLMVELSLYNPSQVHEIVAEYLERKTPDNCDYPFYEFRREKLEIDGYWKSVGLA